MVCSNKVPINTEGYLYGVLEEKKQVEILKFFEDSNQQIREKLLDKIFRGVADFPVPSRDVTNQALPGRV